MLNHWVFYVTAVIYIGVVLGNAGYHFWHGWAHADAERADARQAAIACRENYAIQKRHSSLCAHDAADAEMNSMWFAFRALAVEFTFCPPTSCSEVVETLSGVISKLGLAALFAAAGAMVAAIVALKLFAVLRLNRKEILGSSGALEYNPEFRAHPGQYANSDWPLLEGVRHRGPAVTEIT